MNDTHKGIRPAFCHQRSPTDELVGTLSDGNSVMVTGYGASAAMLDGLGDFLLRTGTRVLRVRPPLDLPDLMQQIVQADMTDADAALEDAFLALTVPGDGYERVALLVDGAHMMTHATLRYLDFAFRSAPELQAVFAGQPAIADTLALDGFASLRARFSLHVAAADTTTQPANMDPAPAGTSVSAFFAAIMPSPPYRMTPARLLASAAVAAGFALAIGSTIQLPRPETPATVAFGFSLAPAGMDAKPGNRATPDQEDGTVAQEHQAEVQPSGPKLSDSNLPGAEHEPRPAAPAFLDAVQAAEPNSGPEQTGPALSAKAAAEAQPRQDFDLPLPPAPLQTPRARAVRSERVTARAPSLQDSRCAAIVLRVQVGEAPTDSERLFLRNGCR